MFNNRSYYVCESHQEKIARARGHSVANKVIGARLDNPIVDFAGLARSFGLYAEGPVEKPEELGPALSRAVEYVAERRAGALVDVITQPR